jgi:hypothetical protein
MSVDADWYPDALDERAAFHLNLKNNLPQFKVKYNISDDVMKSVDDDAAWIVHWAAKQVEADLLAKQLTGYIRTISGNKEDVDAPAAIQFSLTGTAPDEVPPGIEARVRALRREIKNKSNYSAADGQLLGFERAPQAAPDFSQMFPEINLRTLSNYVLEALFSKKGMDAVRFEYRRKGGAWQALGDKATSPATLNIVPQTAGEAEQIEIRAIFLKKYETVGVYSPIYSIVIAP